MKSGSKERLMENEDSPETVHPYTTQNEDGNPYIPTLNTASATFNMINSVVGVGIISLPYAFATGTTPFGVVGIFFFCLICCYTSDLMVLTSRKLDEDTSSRTETFGDLCRNAVGGWLFYVSCSIICIMMFLAMCVYSVVLRISLKGLISDIKGETFRNDKWVLAGVCVGLILPLCLFKNIEWLGFTSFLSIAAVCYFVILAFIKGPEYSKLMHDLTPDIANAVSDKNEVDRNVWVCKVKSAYYPTHTFRTFPICKATNTVILKAAMKTADCDKNADINNKIDAIKTNPLYATGCAGSTQPAKWKEAVIEMYALHIYKDYSLQNEVLAFKKATGIWPMMMALGIYASAFICQQSTYSIYSSLKRKTKLEMRLVHFYSYVIIFALCVSFAACGSYYFEEQAGQNIFIKMQQRFYMVNAKPDIPVNAARILLVLTIILTFPMQNFFMRKNLLHLTHALDKKVRNVDYKAQDPPKLIFFGLTLFIFAITLLVGSFLDEILTVYSLMGSVLASPLIYIIPVICFLSMGKGMITNIKEKWKEYSGKDKCLKIGFPVFVLVLGVIIICFSVPSAIKKEFFD